MFNIGGKFPEISSNTKFPENLQPWLQYSVSRTSTSVLTDQELRPADEDPRFAGRRQSKLAWPDPARSQFILTAWQFTNAT